MSQSEGERQALGRLERECAPRRCAWTGTEQCKHSGSASRGDCGAGGQHVIRSARCSIRVFGVEFNLDGVKRLMTIGLLIFKFAWSSNVAAASICGALCFQPNANALVARSGPCS